MTLPRPIVKQPMRLIRSLLLASPLLLGTPPSIAQEDGADVQATLLKALERAGLDEDADAGLVIDALIHLGNEYAADGIYARALESYQDASELSRREYGLFNETLIGILYQMHRVARAGQEYAVAADLREEAHRLTRRAIEDSVRIVGVSLGTGSPEYLDAKLALAHWLASQQGMPAGDYPWSWAEQARDIYVEALELIGDEFDNDPELKVRALRAMAEDVGTFAVTSSTQIHISNSGGSDGGMSFQDFDSLGGYSYQIRSEPKELVRAERIVKYMDESNPLLHAAVLRDIGDWRMKANRVDKAMKVYEEAWDRLGKLEDGRALQLILFEEPEIIEESARNSLSGILSSAPFNPQGRVELEFIVDESGRANNIRVVRADPEWASGTALSMVAGARFRPRFEDGEFVTAPGAYTWIFRYDPDLAASRGLSVASND